MKEKSLHYVYCLMISGFFLIGCQKNTPVFNKEVQTFCNPININYRFGIDKPSRREAADPTVVLFRNEYYLFASKSGGYWYSDDLAHWNYVECNNIPIEDWAPTAVVIDDTLYFMAGNNYKCSIYKSTCPKEGHWQIAKDSLPWPVADPALFLDNDQRLYFYWGCSDKNPIYGIELDYRNNFTCLGEKVPLIGSHPDEYGWEVSGDFNDNYKRSTWIEGSWMNKINGKYYLQYACPGTQYKSYADGVYIADNPLGPYTLAAHNPFAGKMGGFANGAGHGSTFTDKYGNWWHIGTVTISIKHMFERRLALFPAFLDTDGILFTMTKYGDYPMFIPKTKVNDFNGFFPGWMLLSYKKPVTVSSTTDTLSPCFINDEEIRTYWAAKTGNDTEWAAIDLVNPCTVYALQVNFAEHNTRIFGREEGLCYQYIVESSADNIKWQLLADRSANKSDNPHDYIQLDKVVSCRYLRIRNIHIPGGNIAICGFRVFGLGSGENPYPVKKLKAHRDPADRRAVTLNWNKSENAIGYNVSFGANPKKLYQNYLVYEDTTLTIRNLNIHQIYYFSIESFNENGVVASNILETAK
jgi:xylan 1,4-beta-xylosidase